MNDSSSGGSRGNYVADPYARTRLRATPSTGLAAP
jgi:hypothetical protein